jgi:hypothetical protein
MARVGRLAGSLLVATLGNYYLVGFPKEPCDFAARGFAPPPLPEAWPGHAVQLTPEPGAFIDLGSVVLSLECEGTALVACLVERLIVQRNGSVSERLWRLIVGAADEGHVRPGIHEARYLAELPTPLWNIVREAVLRCS